MSNSTRTHRSRSWSDDIDRAMREVDRPARTGGGVMGASLSLPGWFPYAIIAALVVMLFWRAPAYEAPHGPRSDLDLSTGSHVALLMVAEDVERYRSQTGELPEELPGALGSVLEISYRKLGESRFELRIMTPGGEMVFQDDTGTVRLSSG